MARWAAFLALTGVVVSLLLALARLSQGLVREDGLARPPGSDATADGVAGRPDGESAIDAARGSASGPVLPRFESPEQARRRGTDDRLPTEGAMTDLSPAALLLNVALTQGLFGAVVLGGALYFGIPAAALGVSSAPLSTGLAGLAVGVGLGVALWLGNELAGLVAQQRGAGYDESLRELLAPDSVGGWVLVLGGVFPVIALVEELIFRAAAVGAVAAGLGLSPWPMAVVSSMAFGAAHGAQGRTGIVVTGALGMALAAAFVLTESLLVVVVAHYLVNALELGVHEGLGIQRPSEL